MLNGKRIVVVMPAYRAGRTLEATWRDLPRDIVDDIVVVDDASDDDTVAVARGLGVDVILHPRNAGYGGNQKTCYREALARGADIVVMVHPDYQYDPRLVTPMAGMIAAGVYELVIGSRILGGGALRGGMPLWKYVANRLLTLFENNGRVEIEFSNDTQTPLRLLYHAGRRNAARSGERYVHVTGAIIYAWF